MSASPAEDPSSVLKDDPLLKQVPEVEGYKVLEPCVLYAKVGEGGMGAVYRGRHLNLDIDVAVKCLKNVLAEQSPTFITRFQREARIAASVHHQNLVQVYDISHKNGVHYLVMEFVKGETARERVTRKKHLSEREACKVMLGAAAGLAEAHGQKIVHRDIKPDNILISFDGKVKVSDLGLAKALEVDAGPSLTMGVMGTPQYMAPEQWDEGGKVGPSADVWALGATFYYLLTGEHAIAGGSMQQVYKRICVDPFPDIRQRLPAITNEVKAILDRCVQREVKHRYTDCRELLKDLNKLVLKDEPEASLTDLGSGTMRVPPLLSPPPAETLGHIKVAIQGEDGATVGLERKTPSKVATPERAVSGVPRATEAPESPSPAASMATAPPRQGLNWALGSLAALVLVVTGWWLMDDRSTVASDSRVDSTKSDDPGVEPLEPGVPQEPTADPVVANVETPALPAALAPEPEDLANGEEQGLQEPATEVLPAPVDLPRPSLEVDEPNNKYTQSPDITVSGTAKHLKGALTLVAQPPVPALGSGDLPISDERFAQTVKLPVEGTYTFTLKAEGVEERTFPVIYDCTPPRIDPPGVQPRRKDRQLRLSLTVTDTNEVASVWAGDHYPEFTREDDVWIATVALEEGHNEVAIHARDKAGCKTQTPVKIHVAVDSIAPGLKESTPDKGVPLVPGPTEFKLVFSEPLERVEIDGLPRELGEDKTAVTFTQAVKASQPDSSSEVAADFDLSWKAVDEAGNEESGSLQWPLQSRPTVPDGWKADLELDGDDGVTVVGVYWAIRAKDERTGIWFRLVPERGLYVAETEVTAKQWNAPQLQASSSADAEDRPKIQISWRDAFLYCKGLGYRLPTQDEWKFACLAGGTGPYSFGQEAKILSEYAWSAKDKTDGPQPVRTKKPNAFGLYDMHGNVWEWCADTATEGGYKKLGGSSYSKGEGCTADSTFAGNNGSKDTGFRPVFELPRRQLK